MIHYHCKLQIPLKLKCPSCQRMIPFFYLCHFKTSNRNVLKSAEADQKIHSLKQELSVPSYFPFKEDFCPFCKKVFPWKTLQVEKSRLFTFFFLSGIIVITSFFLNYFFKEVWIAFFKTENWFIDYFFLPLIFFTGIFVLAILKSIRYQNKKKEIAKMEKKIIILDEKVKVEVLNTKR